MPEELFKKAKDVKLKPEDKAHIKNAIMDFMDKNPAAAKTASAEGGICRGEKGSISTGLGGPGIVSPFADMVRGFLDGRLNGIRKNKGTRVQMFGPLSVFKQKKFMPIIIALVLVLGGGTTFAANGSLPGDILYPVKIHVNEGVESALAVSSETKAKVNLNQATRRLEEAEKLAFEGRLSASTQADIESKFTKKSVEATGIIDRLRASGSVDAAATLSSDFESSLRAHQRIIANLSLKDEGDEKTRAAVGSMLGAVERKLARVTESRADAEVVIATSSNQAGIRIAAQNALSVAEKEIAQVKTAANSSASRINDASKATVEARLGVANALVVDGKAKLDASVYGEAFTAFKDAQRVAHEVNVILKSSGKSTVRSGASAQSAADISLSSFASGTAVTAAMFASASSSASSTASATSSESGTATSSGSSNSSPSAPSSNASAGAEVKAEIKVDIPKVDVSVTAPISATVDAAAGSSGPKGGLTDLFR